MTPSELAHAASILPALADPTRLRVFLALREREICVRELVQALGLLQSLVSHHLAVLARAGLVRSRRHRGFTLYALDGEAMARARVALGRLLDPDTLVPAARPGGNPDCCLVGRPAQARAAG